MKKILTISAWSLLIIGMIISLGFINKTESTMPLKDLAVSVNYEDDNYFIDKIDVEEIIHDRGDPIVNQQAETFNVYELERVLNSHPAVANAEVYTTINGEVKVDIEQRKPIVRIINKSQDSYYIDEKGRLMPLSEKFTAKVLIVNGNIDEPYSKFYRFTMAEIDSDTTLNNSTRLDEIYSLAKFIQADTLWRAQIQQVFFNEMNDIELIPRVGDQRIILGDASDLSEKFDKLLIFYLKGLNTTGWWNTYSVINLKYRNQVVCTKKETRPVVKEKPVTVQLAIADTIKESVQQNTIPLAILKKTDKKKPESKKKKDKQ